MIKILKAVIDLFVGFSDPVTGWANLLKQGKNALSLYESITDTSKASDITAQMRERSKLAFDAYCEARSAHKWEETLGIPQEDLVIGYWQHCLNANRLPSIIDLRDYTHSSKEESEMLFRFLVAQWLSVPEFVFWLNGLATLTKIEDLSEKLSRMPQLEESVRKLKNQIPNAIPNWHESLGIQFISYCNVTKAAALCNELDVRDFYRVNSRFRTMFNVICAGRDVSHPNADELLEKMLECSTPIIITGNGGSGKSSLMLRAAVDWAKSGRLAVWIRLNASNVLYDSKAEALFQLLEDAVPKGSTLLLCIDNPYEGRESFNALRRAWPKSASIQLLLAERENRLTVLSDQAEDSLQGWFDDAQVLELGSNAKQKKLFKELGYDWHPVLEDQKRKRLILENAIHTFSSPESLSNNEQKTLIDQVLKKHGQPEVSLAELIFRALFSLNNCISNYKKTRISKVPDVVMDWDEWKRFCEMNLGRTDQDTYELIAAYKLFNVPLSLPLFCRVYNIDLSRMEAALSRSRMSEQMEPITYSPKDKTLQPKHDVIAELYFLFHEKTVFLNEVMRRVLEILYDEEVDILLDQLVDKQSLLWESDSTIGIDYQAYLRQIWQRKKNETLQLKIGGDANLCLGRLWLEQRAWMKQPAQDEEINDLRLWLHENAPPPTPGLNGRDLHGMTRLYMEWGLWERSCCNYKSAEQKFNETLVIDPNDVYCRTALGHLIARDPYRRKEAEEVLRKALENKPDNIPTCTELGRLLSRDPSRQNEAEKIFRDALAINPENIPTLVELGRILAKDLSRRAEAEKVFMKVLEIEPKNVYCRTELGRLLARIPGRRGEAEKIFRGIMASDPQNIHCRTELGRLLAKQQRRWKDAERLLKGNIDKYPRDTQSKDVLARLYVSQKRYPEAYTLYQEILKINPKDKYALDGLAQLHGKNFTMF